MSGWSDEDTDEGRCDDDDSSEDNDIMKFLFSQQEKINLFVVLFRENAEGRVQFFREVVSIANDLADTIHTTNANASTNATKETIFKYKQDYEKCPESEKQALFSEIVGFARSLLQQAIDAHRDSSR